MTKTGIRLPGVVRKRNWPKRLAKYRLLSLCPRIERIARIRKKISSNHCLKFLLDPGLRLHIQAHICEQQQLQLHLRCAGSSINKRVWLIKYRKLRDCCITVCTYISFKLYTGSVLSENKLACQVVDWKTFFDKVMTLFPVVVRDISSPRDPRTLHQRQNFCLVSMFWPP